MDGVIREDLCVFMGKIEDPRIDRKKKYPLPEIIFLVLIAALTGVESWRGIELIGNDRFDFLRKYFDFDNGIPSHQTISRVFSLLKPKSFEDFFMAWTSSRVGGNNGKQIALDGKTVRGSSDKANAKKAVHLLNACAVDCGISLGQLEVDSKSNEIKAVPEMLEALDIKKAMISVDALNTQKDIAEKIINKKANYTLALKGNHKNLNKKVQRLFEDNDGNVIEEFDKGHGRVTQRTYRIVEVDKYNLDDVLDWKGLKAVGMAKTKNLTAETSETRYYLLSYNDDELFSKSARGHWGIESMHWTLDVTFGEDASTKRKDHAPRNYSMVRKLALNILRHSKGKLTVPLARIKAAANVNFLEKILTNWGF